MKCKPKRSKFLINKFASFFVKKVEILIFFIKVLFCVLCIEEYTIVQTNGMLRVGVSASGCMCIVYLLIFVLWVYWLGFGCGVSWL